MIFKKTLKNINPDKLDIETFGEIIDKALEDNEVILQAYMKKGSLIPEIRDNIGGGPVIQFYIALKILIETMRETIEQLDLDKSAKGEMLDGMLELVKLDCMEEAEA